jgi:hypothetical protein
MRNLVYSLFFILLGIISPSFCLAQTTERNFEAEKNAAALFDFLLTPRTDIGANKSAQDLWLTPHLKRLIAATRFRVQVARRAGKEEMGPDPSEPRNDTFLHAWDSPTACVVTSSKPYRDDYLVFVYCGWGERTNYPGTNGHYSLTMQKISGKWLVSDIRFSVNNEGVSTLTKELRNTISQARVFEAKGHW